MSAISLKVKLSEVFGGIEASYVTVVVGYFVINTRPQLCLKFKDTVM